MASKFKYRFGLFPALCGVLIASLFLYLNVTQRIALQLTFHAEPIAQYELGWPQTYCVYTSGWAGAGFDTDTASLLDKEIGRGEWVWNFAALANNVVFTLFFVAAGIYLVEFIMRSGRKSESVAT